MQGSDDEPSARHIWIHHGKQHWQDCLPRCASSTIFSNILSPHVWPATRHTLSHTVCNRSRSILQNDQVCAIGLLPYTTQDILQQLCKLSAVQHNCCEAVMS